jgi:hypothetical protein
VFTKLGVSSRRELRKVLPTLETQPCRRRPGHESQGLLRVRSAVRGATVGSGRSSLPEEETHGRPDRRRVRRLVALLDVAGPA